MGKTPLWQEQARAIGGEDFVAMIESLQTSQEGMAERMEAMGEDIHGMKNSLDNLVKTAFAGGDAEGHRRYHELVIERNSELRRLRIAIQEKTISALIFSAIVSTIGFIGLTVWAYIIAALKGTPTP